MAKDKNRFSNTIQIKNRKARYEYEFIDTYEAGIVLKGTEIKSLREGKANLMDGFCYFKGDEMYLKGVHISPYSQSSFYNHESTRERKLLLHKRELQKIKSKIEEKGLTVIPSKLYINKRGFAKVEIAVAKGKKLHDKRDSIKEKDIKRELDRMKF